MKKLFTIKGICLSVLVIVFQASISGLSGQNVTPVYPQKNSMHAVSKMDIFPVATGPQPNKEICSNSIASQNGSIAGLNISHPDGTMNMQYTNMGDPVSNETLSKKPDHDSVAADPQKARKQKGFTNITAFTVSVGKVTLDGMGTANVKMAGIQTINGYLFSPNFSMGAGVGISMLFGYTLPYSDYYGSWTFEKLNQIVMPLFIDARYNFLNREVTPFLSLDVGYTFSLSSPDTHGGFFVNPMVGFKLFMSKNTALNLGVGYKYQVFSFDSDALSSHRNEMKTYKETYSLLSLNLGITF